jgi:hypothetical protein
MMTIPWARTRGVQARRVAVCRRRRSLRRGRGATVPVNTERISDSRSQARRGASKPGRRGERGASRPGCRGERERKEYEAQGRRERMDGAHGFPGLDSPTTHGPTRPQHLTAGHNVQAAHLSEKMRWERVRRTLRQGAAASLPRHGPNHHPSTHDQHSQWAILHQVAPVRDSDVANGAVDLSPPIPRALPPRSRGDTRPPAARPSQRDTYPRETLRCEQGAVAFRKRDQVGVANGAVDLSPPIPRALPLRSRGDARPPPARPSQCDTYPHETLRCEQGAVAFKKRDQVGEPPPDRKKNLTRAEMKITNHIHLDRSISPF